MVGYSRSSAMAGTALRLFVVSSLVQVSMVAAAGAHQPPAMFVFGDSTLDVGNNNYLTGPYVPRGNMPYYGIDFPGSVATGRFTNGYNIVDYLAKSMGFPSSPPPYLSLAKKTSRLVHATAVAGGVSYASGGAGILDSTNAGNNIPLSKQLQYFNSTKSKIVAKLGSRAANLLLAKSVFLFGIGNNDLFAATATPGTSPAALYQSLISGYSAAVHALHALGARKFAVIDVGAMGCSPAVRVQDPSGACSGAVNQLASGFNDALASLLAGLANDRKRLPGFAYSLADYYGLSAATFADPGASGFTDVAGACCGGGRLGVEAPCGRPNATLCADRDRYSFWDAVHATQRADMLAAEEFYHSRPTGRYTAPITFKQLAQTNL